MAEPEPELAPECAAVVDDPPGEPGAGVEPPIVGTGAYRLCDAACVHEYAAVYVDGPRPFRISHDGRLFEQSHEQQGDWVYKEVLV